jgi:outer membrane lipoprotein-sorting protein
MRSVVLALIGFVLLVGFTPVHADDLVARSRAAYASLGSYSDTGVVTYEATGLTERYTFKTYYRAPRHLYFEFDNEKKSGGRQQILWKEGGDLQSWNSATRVFETIPTASGREVATISSAAGTTYGTSVLILSLLFPKSGLIGTIGELADASAAGMEDIGGRRCYKLVGVARSTYASGQVTNARATSIWIDTETLLVRRVFTDTPKNYPVGSIARLTTTLDPQLNPALEDGRFHFVVPNLQK